MWPSLGDNPTVPPKVTRFTANGTWTPDPLMVYAIAEVQAGGGSGGQVTANGTDAWATGPGSAGSYAMVMITKAQAGSSKVVTVGAAGVLPGDGTGGTGGVSSIGSLVSCPGGLGGGAALTATVAQASGGAAPAAATISGCTLIDSETGQSMVSAFSQAYQNGSNQLIAYGGAGSRLGAGGTTRTSAAAQVTGVTGGIPAADAWGAGGQGCAGYGNTGIRNSAGAVKGIVIITEYF